MDSIEKKIKEQKVSVEQELREMVKAPTKLETDVLNKMVKKYQQENPDDVLPYALWDGKHYKEAFAAMEKAAKEIDADPWDVFAAYLHKIEIFDRLGKGLNE